MSCAVVDSGDQLVAFERMDGADLVGITLARDKAFTALANRMSTADLAPIVQPGAESLRLRLGGRWPDDRVRRRARRWSVTACWWEPFGVSSARCRHRTSRRSKPRFATFNEGAAAVVPGDVDRQDSGRRDRRMSASTDRSGRSGPDPASLGGRRAGAERRCRALVAGATRRAT